VPVALAGAIEKLRWQDDMPRCVTFLQTSRLR
jgi:hypothetical protein